MVHRMHCLCVLHPKVSMVTSYEILFRPKLKFETVPNRILKIFEKRSNQDRKSVV